MTREIWIVLIIDAVLLLGLVIFLAIRCAKEKKAESIEEVVEQPVEQLEPTPQKAENVEDPEDDRKIKKPLTFAEKMLDIDEKSQSYYEEIFNKFKSMKKVNGRISKKCLSYRFNKALIAKVSVHGKTLKLNLALDPNAFDQKVYFQKDVSSVKAYAEVPFAVKVKSDRGLKKAIALIESLANDKGVEYKTRFVRVNAIEELKSSVEEQ